MHSQLLQAYRNTGYRIDDRGDGTALILRIGQRDAALEQWLREQHADCATFITACNPHSRALGETDNGQRMATLVKALDAAGWRHVAGAGVPDAPGWSAEPSVMVPGMDAAEARRWGRRFDQNAVVLVEHGQPPRLLWLAG